MDFVFGFIILYSDEAAKRFLEAEDVVVPGWNDCFSCFFKYILMSNGENMFRYSFSKGTIRKIVKVSCIVQLVNAFMDYFLWVSVGYHVPSWAIATLTAGYSVILLSYDRLVS